MTQQNQKTKKQERRKATTSINTMAFGKIPPQARELEVAVLGAILLEREAIDLAADIVKPEMFYVAAHQLIFSACQSLVSKSQPIDQLTVAEELKLGGNLDAVGGDYYLTTLTNSVVSSAHIEKHCRIILEKFVKREAIRISGEMIGLAYEDMADAIELMDTWEKEITELSFNRFQDRHSPYDAELVKRFQRIMELRLKESHITGIPSGFPSLDRITHGWQDTDLIILAARPSVGKTALALQLARNACFNEIRPVPVALFSLEMSKGQLIDRQLASESEIWLERITSGQLDDEGMNRLYTKGVAPLSKMKIHIDDTPALNLFELRARVRRLKRKWKEEYGTDEGLVIIDYLQLMSGMRGSGNREQEISEISRGLKALAKEIGWPIIAISQLSREPEKRKGDLRTPQLSDLRESGAIEQDADLVMFMYRPEYYEDTVNELGESRDGETHITISKHRNGKLAKGKDAIKLRANLAIQKFYDWDPLQDVKSSIGIDFSKRTGNWRPVKEDEKGNELSF